MNRLFKILPFLFISACEEAFEYQPAVNEELLVVEAMLTNERKPQEVRLSKTFSSINEPPPPVTNAIVAIFDGDTTYWLRQNPSEPGTYLSDTLQALFGKVYTLLILHEGNEYFAQATSTFGSPLEPFGSVEVDTGIYEFIYQQSAEPSMTEVIVEWEEIDENGEERLQRREAYFYTLNSLDINTIFAPDKEPLRFPVGSTIFRRKFSLTDSHRAFLRSFLAEVDWRGGIFDVSPGNVTTNLSEGAVGYFSVSMVRSESIIFEGK